MNKTNNAQYEVKRLAYIRTYHIGADCGNLLTVLLEAKIRMKDEKAEPVLDHFL